MKQYSFKKVATILVTTIVVLSLILFFISPKTVQRLVQNVTLAPTPTPIIPPGFFQRQGPEDKAPAPTVPAFPTYTLKANQKVSAQPQSTTNIPTTDSGVDSASPSVSDSTTQIQLLSSALPLTLTTTLSTKLTVDINIPASDLQPNDWTLFVDIQNIDFDVQPGDQNYSLMRNSFREAANDVFTWVRTQGADPAKIYFVWGDKSYQQNTAEKWLKN